jgi:hypothetical protein
MHLYSGLTSLLNQRELMEYNCQKKVRGISTVLLCTKYTFTTRNYMNVQ